MASKPPFIRRYESKDGTVKRFTLVRGSHRVHKDGLSWDRENTTAFDESEWAIIERTVLAEYGLISERQSRENVDVAYQEAERAQAQVAHLERELKYAAEGEDDDSPR